jgi:small subunit ribosomal protein S13
MIFFAGIEIPETTSVWKALLQVPGLSITSATAICARFGLTPKIRLIDLTLEQRKMINIFVIKNYIINRTLENIMISGISRTWEDGARRGIRLRRGYPINGQRTRSNAKTARKKLELRIVPHLRDWKESSKARWRAPIIRSLEQRPYSNLRRQYERTRAERELQAKKRAKLKKKKKK